MANENVDVARPMRLTAADQVKDARGKGPCSRRVPSWSASYLSPPKQIQQGRHAGVGGRQFLVRGIQRSEQSLRWDVVEIPKWSRVRARYFDAQLTRRAWF